MIYEKYKRFIEDNLNVLDKTSQQYVKFNLNPIQSKFIREASSRDIVLKARQQGFSSLILAIFTADFLLKENSTSVIVADISDNALDLLGRVKGFINAYEENCHTKVPLKYNSKYELHNAANNARYIIGTAENTHFGRSKTITNLHMSEAAFYLHLKDILASAGTALVPDGKFIIETTANGFNEFKEFWDASLGRETGFQALFYPASDFYSDGFLEKEHKRLGSLYPQEYPETAEEAFLTSGDMYFDKDTLRIYLNEINDYEKMASLSEA